MSISTALNFSHTFRDGVLILELKGAVDSALALEPVIELSVKSPATDVVVVISDVDYINSAGFSALIRMAEALDEQQKNIYLVGLQSKVHLVFDSIGAHSVFNVLPTLDAAFAAIKAKP
ncbi:MAG TPA: STAS domain-containing protein [Planctomycetota bacterium]|nr:STAS domain-containing protein [Planctomycetota bacterium]